MESTRELLKAGKQHFEHKRYNEAEHCLRLVIDENPKYADVFNMLGVISHVEGKFASAIDSFEKALKINPNYTEATLNLAVLYNDLGQYGKARKLYSKLKGRRNTGSSRIEPVLRGKLSNLHADIGDIYRSIGLYGLAVDEYNKALNLNPTYLDIRTKLGQALREDGLLGESLSQLKAVLKNKGSYSPALIQLGITLYTMDKLGEAKKAWKKALDKEPENDYAKMYLRLCLATEAAAKKDPPSASKSKASKKVKGTKKAKKIKKAKTPTKKKKKR